MQHLMQSFQRMSGSAMVREFRVNYKRHVLTMDDLSTLYGQNWLNDQVSHNNNHNHNHKVCLFVSHEVCVCFLQVMNMYGDLVMDAVPDQVRTDIDSLLHGAVSQITHCLLSHTNY